jgi:hypothetical protein
VDWARAAALDGCFADGAVVPLPGGHILSSFDAGQLADEIARFLES